VIAASGPARADDHKPAHVVCLVIIKKNDKIGGGLSDGQED